MKSGIQGLHCLLSSKQSSVTEVDLNLKILTCDPLIITMNHPRLSVSNQMEEFISIQSVIKQVLGVITI